jgi:multidrug efflux pump subunit AcrA (membrane-fusion protein)
VVNQNLIQRTESGDIIYVASDNVARQRKIKTGLAYNGQVEVTEGSRPATSSSRSGTRTW